MSVLIIAALKGKINILKYLIASIRTINKDSLNLIQEINQEDRSGNTALMYAAANGHLSCVNLLLKNGANIDKKNSNGTTVLMIAAQNGHESLVKEFLPLIKDINDSDNNKCTALMYAVAHCRESIVNLLLKNGANIGHCDNFGWTALMLAKESRDQNIIKRLEKAQQDEIPLQGKYQNLFFKDDKSYSYLKKKRYKKN